MLPVIDAGWRGGRCFRVAPHRLIIQSIAYFLIANRDMTESESERQMHRVEPRRKFVR